MSTVKVLAGQLGVSDRTIRSHKKDGYCLVFLSGNKVDIEKSVHAYVKYQSEIIRKMKAQTGRILSCSSGNSKQPKTLEDWKLEKEKQSAIKIRLQNEYDLGELIPIDALMDLYNKPLSYVKRELLDVSNRLSKRIQLDPASIKLIDDLVREALEGLNEKGLNELQEIITPILEGHSKYYSATDEDPINPLGGD